MPKDLVKVTALPTKINIGSDTYGPFRATESKPYTEVPSGLAFSLSLPIYTEPDKEETTEAKAPAASTSTQATKPAASKPATTKASASKPAAKTAAPKAEKKSEPEAPAAPTDAQPE